MAKYRKYSKEFKLQAAKLVVEQVIHTKKRQNGLALPVGRSATGYRNSDKAVSCLPKMKPSQKQMNSDSFAKRMLNSEWRTTY